LFDKNKWKLVNHHEFILTFSKGQIQYFIFSLKQDMRSGPY